MGSITPVDQNFACDRQWFDKSSISVEWNRLTLVISSSCGKKELQAKNRIFNILIHILDYTATELETGFYELIFFQVIQVYTNFFFHHEEEYQ
jgi:hypothetical protein